MTNPYVETELVETEPETLTFSMSVSNADWESLRAAVADPEGPPEEYPPCPICGDPIDYCQGHGELGGGGGGERPCWNCGGSGVRCCEYGADRGEGS
jgi:hypothetical protein